MDLSKPVGHLIDDETVAVIEWEDLSGPGNSGWAVSVEAQLNGWWLHGTRHCTTAEYKNFCFTNELPELDTFEWERG